MANEERTSILKLNAQIPNGVGAKDRRMSFADKEIELSRLPKVCGHCKSIGHLMSECKGLQKEMRTKKEPRADKETRPENQFNVEALVVTNVIDLTLVIQEVVQVLDTQATPVVADTTMFEPEATLAEVLEQEVTLVANHATHISTAMGQSTASEALVLEAQLSDTIHHNCNCSQGVSSGLAPTAIPVAMVPVTLVTNDPTLNIVHIFKSPTEEVAGVHVLNAFSIAEAFVSPV
ncbi:hypothetical protein IFM89_003894 [Coptis chinensis]|uniref:Uncharacterized protein n=1 Tax=Coptis chinensis TaxID=261450 RepID=A0A835LYM8_9MAGN|nr:hypothetical protein IFM89_003894 [Coptis chinensis]